MNLDLTIIIITYNTEYLVLNSIRNVYNNTKNISFEIVCVDNKSNDNTVKLIKKEFTQVRLIENIGNKGYAFANNQGIKIGKGRYIAFYNPDTELVGNVFGKMVGYMETHPNISAIGPQLLNNDNTVQVNARNGYINLWNEFIVYSGLYSFFPNFRFFNKYRKGIYEVTKIQTVDQITTACLVVRSNIIENIGGMDENFFLYGDDVDFCKRIIDSGYKILFYPKVKVYHFKGQSSKKNRSQVNIWILDSHYYFIKKHSGAWQARSFRIMIWILGLIWLIIWISFRFIIKKDCDDEIERNKNRIKWSLNLS